MKNIKIMKGCREMFWAKLVSFFDDTNFTWQYYWYSLQRPYLTLPRYYQCCYRFSVNLWVTRNCAWLVSLSCATANQVQRCSTWLSSSSIASAPIKCDHSSCLTSGGWPSLNILAMKRCKLTNYCYRYNLPLVWLKRDERRIIRFSSESGLVWTTKGDRQNVLNKFLQIRIT